MRRRPRLLARVAGARVLVALAVACGLLSAVLVVVEALLLSAVVGAAFLGSGPVSAVPAQLAAMAVLVGARLPLGVAGARLGEAAAARSTGRLRIGLLGQPPRGRPGRRRPGAPGRAGRRHGRRARRRRPTSSRSTCPPDWLAITVPLLVLAVVALIDPPTTLVLLATGPLLVLLLAVIGGRTRILTQRRFDETRWLGAFFLDLVAGIATLKMFGRSAEQVDTIQRLGRRYADTSMEVLRTAFQTSLVLEWGASIAVALVAVEISLRLMAGSIAFDRALAVLVVTPAFFLPLRQLAGQYHVGAAGRAAAARILAILDGAPPRTAAAEPGLPGAVPLAEIRLDGLTGSYPERDAAAVDGVDLTLPAGSIVALVGPTGAGKSTIIAMLLRFLEPRRGAITVGGRPLAAIDPGAWRAAVAWVPQHPQLVHASIADNLRLARPDATDDRCRGRPPRRLTPPSSSRSSRPAPTPSSGRAGTASAAARFDGWRSPARSSPRHRSCSSTSRRPTSTRRPSGTSPRPSSGCAAAPPSSSRPTTDGSWPSPTRWSSSTTGGSPRSVRRATSSTSRAASTTPRIVVPISSPPPPRRSRWLLPRARAPASSGG